MNSTVQRLTAPGGYPRWAEEDGAIRSSSTTPIAPTTRSPDTEIPAKEEQEMETPDNPNGAGFNRRSFVKAGLAATGRDLPLLPGDS